MRVLVCPDKFAGTLSAGAAARAIAEGWLDAASRDEVTVRPLADGGPGFLDVLGAGRMVEVPTVGPLGDPAVGRVLIDGSVAYVESADACGLHLLARDRRDPRATTSFGLGALVVAAIEAGARQVVVGLGGSVTNDGGAGLLSALGASPADPAGFVLPYGGAALAFCAGLVGVPQRRGAVLIGASDVDAPLVGPTGASFVYGPQKGATADDVVLLDAALAAYAAVLERELPTCPPGLAGLPGAGAAGGLGAAILALGGTLESGIDLVRRVTGFDAALPGCDLVITGEGRFDDQSLHGKVVSGVAGAARAHGIDCVVLAGQVDVGQRAARAAGVLRSYSLVDHFGSAEEAMARPAEGLRALAGRLAVTHGG